MFSTKFVFILHGSIKIDECSLNVSLQSCLKPRTIDFRSKKVVSDMNIFFLSDNVPGALLDSACQFSNQRRTDSSSSNLSSFKFVMGR